MFAQIPFSGLWSHLSITKGIILGASDLEICVLLSNKKIQLRPFFKFFFFCFYWWPKVGSIMSALKISWYKPAVKPPRHVVKIGLPLRFYNNKFCNYGFFIELFSFGYLINKLWPINNFKNKIECNFQGIKNVKFNDCSSIQFILTKI